MNGLCSIGPVLTDASTDASTAPPITKVAVAMDVRHLHKFVFSPSLSVNSGMIYGSAHVVNGLSGK